MNKSVKSDLSTIAEKEKVKREAELVIADAEKAKCPAELVIIKEEKAELEDELIIVKEEKTKLEDELIIANKDIANRAAELVIANEEKAKRAAELVIANEEKGKRAAELVIANAEKAKRAAELVITNSEKVKRAAVLVIANLEKAKRADELIIADKELAYQNEEKVKRAAELVISDINNTKREAELVIAKIEKAKRIAKSIIADKDLSFQTGEKAKREAELVIADAEKSKREAELITANIKKANRSAELVIANVEKAKRAAELVIAHKELVYQKSEKVKHATELIIANVEKAKRAAALVISNIEKAKRAAELVITNKELVLATERAKLTAELILLNKELELANKQEKLIKEEYFELYNFAPSGYLTLTREGKISELNLLAAKILGKKLSFLKDRWFGNYVSDDTKPIFNSFIEQIFKSHTQQLCDVTLSIGNDIPIYVYLSGIVTKDANQCLITVDDISERKKVEEKLEKSEKLLKSVFDSSDNLINVVDRDLRIVMSNWRSPIYAGYTEFPIGAYCFEAFINRDKPCEPCPTFSIFNTGKPVFFEYYNQATKLYKEINAYPILDDDNNVTMVVENVRDITENKLAEKALRESEEKFRSIMENSADAIFITNQEGKYVYTNKEFTAMLGYTSEEMLNKTIADISPTNKIEEYIRIFEQILIKGKMLTELELIKKDGSQISTELNAVLLPDGTIYGSCRDITERKHTEFELIKAKEKAEESDRLKSAFLTNMSHEIRTPMNGILGFAELLKEPSLTIAEQQDYIQTMQISGARMLYTLNSIVDISKIESGLISINIEETNLNEKIEFTYKFFKPEAEIKGLQFLYKNGLPTNEAIIKTDNEKVYGILTNLVRNAIKFTYDGSIELGYEKKGEYLKFFVKDTGIGIPQKHQQTIFERFRQGSESLNRGYEGSGLGLSISKSYVEMLGGMIWVESEEGLGSTFYFTIPYNPVLEETTAISNDVSAEQKEVQLQKLKILVVEDDEISYSLLTRTLQKISKEVLHAITGFEAVEACRNNPDLDLVLMDIRMPEMNGLEATQQIRQFNKDVIIIAQTAYAFSGDSEKAIAAGCNDYISKPINKTLLYDLIKKHVNK